MRREPPAESATALTLSAALARSRRAGLEDYGRDSDDSAWRAGGAYTFGASLDDPAAIVASKLLAQPRGGGERLYPNFVGAAVSAAAARGGASARASMTFAADYSSSVGAAPRGARVLWVLAAADGSLPRDEGFERNPEADARRNRAAAALRAMQADQ